MDGVKNFDATNIPPQQMGDKHPVGMFQFQITDTFGKANKDTPGGQFVVELTSPVGKVFNRYNLWNASEQAREIAHKELSALCHACGIFKLSFENLDPKDYGRELRGARGSMKVDLQDNSKPDGYIEVKKIFDINGNEPGKSGANAQPQPQKQPEPQNGSWGNQQQQQPQQGSGGWSQGPKMDQQPQGGGGSPPWVR